MLAALLSSELSAVVTPETPFIISLYRAVLSDDHDKSLSPGELLSRLRRDWYFKVWQFDWNPGFGERDESLGYSDFVLRLIQDYANHCGNPDPEIWIDHTPHNMRYARTLLTLFPDASFIHIHRDGRAVANSVLPLDWGPNTIDAAAKWWERHTCAAIAAQSFLPEERTCRVSYSQLVRDPASTLDTIADSLNIDTSRVSDIGTTTYSPPPHTKDQHSLVGSRPDPARVTAWENELRTDDIELFNYYASDLLGFLGYEDSNVRLGVEPDLITKTRLQLKECVLRPLNKIRWWYRYLQAA